MTLASAMILSGWENDRVRAIFDQETFHLPVIRDFAAQLPALDLRDYASATTPGYHIAFALIVKFIGDQVIVLRLLNALLTAGMLGLLAFVSARRFGLGAGLLCASPAMCSMYILSSGIWLLPDNVGWLFVLIILALTWRRDFAWRATLFASATLLALVLTRQIHIWAAGCILATAWLGAVPEDQAKLFPAKGLWRETLGRTALAAVTILPSFGALAWFACLWGGLVPLRFQGEYQQVQGPNFAVPVFVLVLFLVSSMFYIGFWIGPVIQTLCQFKRARVWLVAGFILGLLAGLIPVTGYEQPIRSSGLWVIARITPEVAGRSPAMALLAAGGGGLAALLFFSLPRRTAWMFLATIVAYTLAQTAQAFAWQRYNEPMMLLLLPLLCTTFEMRQPRTRFPAAIAQRLAPLGPALLAALLLAAAVGSLMGRSPSRTHSEQPAESPPHSRIMATLQGLACPSQSGL